MNEALRKHVTAVGFQLTLTRRQIASLTWLALNQSATHYPRHLGDWVMPVRGLGSRGLVQHFWPPIGYTGLPEAFNASSHDYPVSAFYQITPAGHMVLALLREAGLFDESLREIIVQ